MAATIDDRGIITFSSGNVLDANGGIVGLAPDGEVYDGYDGRVWQPPSEWTDQDFTLEDMTELASMMIERWTRLRETLERLKAVASNPAS